MQLTKFNCEKTNEMNNEAFEELPRNRPTYWLTRFMILRLLDWFMRSHFS